MATVTDASSDALDREDRAADGPGHETARGDANPNANHTNGVHLPGQIRRGTVTDPLVDADSLADGESGAAASAGAKPAIDFSPAVPPHSHHRGHSGGTGPFSFLSGGIHIGASGSVAIPRGGSVGGIHRGGSGGIHRGGSGNVGGGIHRHGSGSVAGGVHRGRSGVHLPSLTSISFAMARLPEEDAGLQMHFTETKEVEEPLPESPTATDEDAPPRKKNRMRKHLTAVGACSFGFRLSECVLSLLAIVVMCSNSQYMGASFGTLKFNHFQAYKYLVATNIFVFVYSTLQFIQLAYTVIAGISFIPSIILSTWLTFGFDQLFSYLLLSASTSAATVANMSYTGEMGVRFCSRYDLGSFCSRADAAVTMSFFAFLAMLSSTILAIHRIAVLLREY